MTTNTTPDICDLTAVRTAELVRSGLISPVETVEASIARIEEHDGTVNAVVYRAFEEACATAARLEDRLRRGENVGPMAGVPALIKDSFSSKASWPVSSGLSAMRNMPAGQTTTLPRRLEAADAILLGTTNSAVFGFRGTTDSKAFGPCRNPHDPRYNAGGSSGGSAAAVAAGYVPVAGATDVGGSIRIPAAWCGVFGFQPTPGRVPFTPSRNLFGPSPYFFEGPLTRTVEDAAFTMDVLQGYDPGDPAALTGRLDFLRAYGAGQGSGLEGLKVGVTADYGVFPLEARIREVYERQLSVLQELGADLVEVDFGLRQTQQELSAAWSRLTAIGTMAAMDLLKQQGFDLVDTCRDELPEPMMAWVHEVESMPIRQVVADQMLRSDVFRAFESVFETVDLVAAPTVAAGPVPNGDDGLTQGPSVIEGQDVDPLIGWCMSYLTNFTGNPSANIPCVTDGGLPVGLQLTGRRHGDCEVIRASAAIEAAAPWIRAAALPSGR